MFFLGGLFALLWAVGLRVGRKGEEIQARLAAEAEAEAAAPPEPDDGAEPG
jgi:hypothetical protein